MSLSINDDKVVENDETFEISLAPLKWKWISKGNETELGLVSSGLSTTAHTQVLGSHSL